MTRKRKMTAEQRTAYDARIARRKEIEAKYGVDSTTARRWIARGYSEERMAEGALHAKKLWENEHAAIYDGESLNERTRRLAKKYGISYNRCRHYTRVNMPEYMIDYRVQFSKSIKNEDKVYMGRKISDIAYDLRIHPEPVHRMAHKGIKIEDMPVHAEEYAEKYTPKKYRAAYEKRIPPRELSLTNRMLASKI